MKKIALTVAAVAALGLAACTGEGDTDNTAVTNVEATTENAVEDVSLAVDNATNAADNALENAVEADNAAGNVAE